MIKKITVLSNAADETFGTDALSLAFRDVAALLEKRLGKEVFAEGSKALSSPQLFRTNLLAACSRVTTHGEAIAEKIVNEVKCSDSLLLGDVRGLSAAEWVPALTPAQNPVAWVVSDWPREFPFCDPVRATLRNGTLARRLIASACAKLAYKREPARRDCLAPISAAIFASETLRERNRQSFPQLEKSYIIPPPVDTDIFRFKPTTPSRAKAWGWIGNAETDAEDAAVALRIFAFEALQHPEAEFYIASDLRSREAQKMIASVRNHPALAPRVSFLQPPQSKSELAAILRDLGVLVEPRRQRRDEFPQLIAAALACGCFPLCGHNSETENLLRETPEMLFPADTPSGAFLRCEKIGNLSLEARTKILQDYAKKIESSASVETVSRRFADVFS